MRTIKIEVMPENESDHIMYRVLVDNCEVAKNISSTHAHKIVSDIFRLTDTIVEESTIVTGRDWLNEMVKNWLFYNHTSVYVQMQDYEQQLIKKVNQRS